MKSRFLFSLLLLSLSLMQVHAKDKRDTLADYDASVSDADRKHWAYQPVRAPKVPEVRDRAWTANPIDSFILAGLEKRKWQPATIAPSPALLRRAYLDLIGLPPSIQEQPFLADPSPGRWERLIEDLLARPGYGERWGRHWLDVVRYAETNGYERDATKPFVWRYRDYVIRAFNSDKPYDRFVMEQLAGDELKDASSETFIATGFHRLGPWDDEPADPKEDRFDQLNDMVSTTSLVFLGLTMGCARCHDHKYDAITMHDYYRMVAIFNPLKRPRKGRMELVLPAGSRQEIATKSAQLPKGYFLHETSGAPPETFLLKRGKASAPGPKVEPGFPTVLAKNQPRFLKPTEQTTQRRLTMARWIADAKNPLTARVIVNRIWQHHFGQGLVRTPSDFGVMGARPTHPELLDWLTHWFIEQGWSMKKLHRLIMTSSTYQMSKTWNRDYAAKDPENELLWRFPYQRLEVEAIRDSMLAISGQLNRQMHGPSIYPQVPKEALAGHSDPEKIWKAFQAESASRRTVYAFIKRSFIVPMLEVLDYCDTAQSTDKRQITTVATQALTLFNGDFVNRQSEHLAARLVREAGHDPQAQIERAYRLALCRPPTTQESQALQKFLKSETKALQDESKDLSESVARERALIQMCRVILNLNELMYPD